MEKLSLAKKNYFIDADWIPNNREAGLIRDVTAELATAAEVGVKNENSQNYSNERGSSRSYKNRRDPVI